ncbi:hypothetical protein BELL_0902g00020 [Botrytis elliptica]|uniref:SWI-SNF chromatin-remodeling complex protein n=1 Tax=Botrytis elliptica TaxID=278938 RepID=A0A4Z1J0Z0_9HELO|nr:hypothetical protein EAE99_012159 [Botrytis elliptica]TGO67309.1 hypothetical protein BELL_0902g00020 [Botrytis elliptica]
MARPYINTSDKNGSLLNPTSGGSNTPISYRANVNRQKTKKWAEAKKIDYGGDDWGDDDEYDPYDAYGNELDPAPAPISKPTGLRQPGQGLPSARGMSQDRSQKSYGNLPSASVGSPLNRRNSFEADDESRHFSNATIRQESPLPTSPPHSADSSTVAATRFSQMGVGGIKHTRDPSGPPTLHISTQQPSPTGLRKPSLSANPVPPESSFNNETISQPARTNTNDSSVLSVGSVNTPSDYGTSKDFSPSAVPAPLSMRPAPAPQSATIAAPTTKFPARKSSLSTMGVEAQRIYQRSHETLGQPFPTSSRPSPAPGSADRSATIPGASDIQPLPFIRPADIYRRVEEEKQERERASLDLVRPSMDSLRMEGSSDISHSPGQGAVRGRSSSDSLGPGNRGRFSFGDEGSDSGRRLMPILEPVKERKSEYGFDGFNANEIPSPAQEITNPPNEPKITSPILPDVHRISGFGSDFFSRSTNDSAPAPPTETISELPEQTSSGNSDPPGDTSLRSQPSFGFKSVVNQAFDRKDDNSVPPTPVSNTEGNIKRSDSESTGTIGISPIMSRGPSTTDNRDREMSTPAIMEQAEPISPRLQNIPNESDNQIVPPTFIPGHRRDISTPSPGNSPARTPDLGNASKRISMGEQAWISSASPTSPAEDAREDADPEPPRPTLDRDVSFRPQIPGGWQSYTTTATTSTVQPETPRSPSPQVPSDPVQALAMEDLTPTTTKHSLPESSLEAARVTLGVKSDSMPTPDPNGNVHSAMTPHPELIPSLEKASPEAQLQPDFVDQPNPPDSSSIPPIKDSLVYSEEPASETLLEPSTDFQPGTADEFNTDELLLPPLRLQVLPTLSTDTGPLDEENDRLRKDIVKSLSPRPSQSEQGHENLRERPISDNMEESRESTYLTDVYDDYWNDIGDEDHSSPIATSSPDKLQAEQAIPADMPEIRPLSSHRMSKQQARPPLPTRFSWEKSMDTVAPTDTNTPESPTNQAELPVERADAPIEGLQQMDPEPYMEKEVLEEVPHNNDHVERNIALGAGAVLLGGGATANNQHTVSPESPPTVNVSLAQEKEQPQFASYPIVPTPENEHPAYGSTLDLSTDPLGSNPHSASSSPNPFIAREPSPSRRESATSPRTSSMGKILTFKEIVGMKEVHERVHAFDETRERFAAMDSGIHEWIFALKAEQPEHADVNECYGGFRTTVPTGSTRRNTRSGSAALQSPYYQQYLNASAPSQASVPASRTGQTGPSGIQQGFSPAHAKITTQQVQAKGKEFLHTAGIFGGKAGKAGFQAGKGLLAKGKNRLRAAGSSDKTSPPPKSRNPDRSSWGLALNLSRATGRTDPVRNAEQNILSEPTRHSQISTSSDVLTPIGMVGIPPTSDEEAQAGHAEGMNLVTRDTAGEILAPDKTDEQYVLNPPAPISKYELTWDPFDTAQFADSNYFTNDKQTNQHLIKDDCESNSLSVLPRSARSISDDTASNNAQRENLNRRNSAAAASVIGGYTVQGRAELESSTRVPISMINRPRGASLDQATTSDHFSRPTIGSVQTPLSTQPTNQTTAAPEEQGRQPSSKTLPPIRRTSKFGFEFGSRRPQTRFPISDDEDEFEIESNGGTQDAVTSNAAEVKENLVPQQNSHADVAIADIVRDPKANLPISPQPRFSVFPRVADPFVQRSPTQDMGRSNPAIRHNRQDSWNSVSKNSRSRRGSTSDKQFVQPRDSNAPPLIPALPFETPPSSTQRYPELFGGPVTEIRSDPDMPGGYHQAPPSRTEPFPSYHRADELPGARPLESANEPTAHRRRRSSDLVNRGINLVRSLSRERRSSVSKEEKKYPINTSASSPMRDDRQKRRGSGFWGTFDISGEQSSNSGRESMVAQHSGSQSNFMSSQHDSPQTPKSFLNPNSTLETSHSNMFGRSTTTMGKTLQKDEKRSRLSGLSGLFTRSPKGDGSVLFKPKRATTDLSSFGPRTGTLSSPQFEDHSIQSTNMGHKRRPSQPLNFLSKLGPSTSLQKTETPSRQDSKLHLEPRPRRPSVSGLLTGMLRKRSNTLEKDSERNEDDGRKPVVVPVARMYSDLGSESHEVLPDAITTPAQRLKKKDQEQEQTRSSRRSDGNKQDYSHPRSHHHPRWYDTPPRLPEPQYDSVPIPDGYNLVRGDGTTPTPTNYDPRGINKFNRPSLGEDLPNSSQQYSVPSPVSPLAYSGSSILHQSPPLHQTFSPERRLINLPSIDTHRSPLISSIRTDLPSDEDILARSPAREQPGQQRPFQLALPHSSDAHDQYYRSSTPPVHPSKDEHLASRSPTSVPLPMGEFSPSYENIDIDRFPLPPSPSQQNPDWHRNRNLSVATDDDLRRSSTGRSLVSAVSQISDSPSPQPHRVSVMDDKLYVDCDDDMKHHGDKFSNPVSRLPSEDADLGDRYSERKEENEVAMRGGEGVADINEREISEYIHHHDVVNKITHAKEDKLQMSATSYPGMEWNPYVDE